MDLLPRFASTPAMLDDVFLVMKSSGIDNRLMNDNEGDLTLLSGKPLTHSLTQQQESGNDNQRELLFIARESFTCNLFGQTELKGIS